MLASVRMSNGVYGLRLLARPSVQRVVLGLLVFLILVYRALQFAGWVGQPVWGYDFSAYWSAAHHLLAGTSPYTSAQLSGPFVLGPADLYQYPPALAAFLVPFAWLLPFAAAQANWLWSIAEGVIVGASVLALGAAEGLGTRFAMLRGRGRWWLVAAAFAFPPTIDQLVVGHVNVAPVGLFTVAWLGLKRGGGRGDVLAAVAIGA